MTVCQAGLICDFIVCTFHYLATTICYNHAHRDDKWMMVVVVVVVVVVVTATLTIMPTTTYSNFLDKTEFLMHDDGHFRLKHVVNKFVTVLSDFNQLCYMRD
jgi:membrane protein YdbS with pleckstrin-like domain